MLWWKADTWNSSSVMLFISKLLLPRLVYGAAFHHLMERMSLDAPFIYYLMWQVKWQFVCVCRDSICYSIWASAVCSHVRFFGIFPNAWKNETIIMLCLQCTLCFYALCFALICHNFALDKINCKYFSFWVFSSSWQVQPRDMKLLRLRVKWGWVFDKAKSRLKRHTLNMTMFSEQRNSRSGSIK